jgi:virulence factor Mce-like protein
MKATRKAAAAMFDNPILVGTVTILVVLVAVYLSYIAENGLPFVPTYSVNVDVQNAGTLIKNADVRIGGARVGQVLTITPEPATKAWPHPFARLGLSLQRGLEPLAPDTRYQVRLASVLGGNYVEIIPGHSRGPGLADGGTFTLNTNPRLNHDLPFVDLDSALASFGPKTKAGLRGSLTGLGDAVAGRGAQLNGAIGSARDLLGPLDNLLTLLAEPGTRLPTFVSGLAATTGALAPVAPTVNSLLAAGATTFAALTRSSLGQTIDQLPATEAITTQVLRRAEPVLSEAATIVQALKPSAALVPEAARRLDAVVTAATPVFRQTPRLAAVLTGAAVSIDALARDPAAAQTFKVLGTSDLGTLGASAFVGLGAILQSVSTAQFACNVAGVWVRNFASALSEGDSSGTWLRLAPILNVGQTFQSATPAPDLHLNYYPIENSSQCQAGNEVYTGSQLIGNPPTTSRTVDNTSPPPGVLARGEQAGLVP